MSKPKHTPGPWCTNLESISSAYPIMPGKLGDCENYLAYVRRGDQESKANARLIAAAPDLLEAAQHAIDTFEVQTGLICNEGGEMFGKLLKAIKKARGEE